MEIMSSIGAWQIILLLLVILIPGLMFLSLFKLSKSALPSDRKIIWTIIILLFPFFGATAYLLVGHNSAVE
ncbi:Phospholipase_D-nuclease N-terminal [Sinomicrobium oceani]|uniref:Phospholipase_D-nuclease N-terminal n=1 Tax=Sinomicrobium oceani TaxID=1150368 RepID=A0A1K1NU80_9FLAO|nr:PLD nuclease N-terminal domain-containing protein [Sinomicrobium oceani]SFW38833.1 Phospholipase_D-nuclease N-terminal [Sinomicrobium oceani]